MNEQILPAQHLERLDNKKKRWGGAIHRYVTLMTACQKTLRDFKRPTRDAHSRNDDVIPSHPEADQTHSFLATLPATNLCCSQPSCFAGVVGSRVHLPAPSSKLFRRETHKKTPCILCPVTIDFVGPHLNLETTACDITGGFKLLDPKRCVLSIDCTT